MMDGNEYEEMPETKCMVASSAFLLVVNLLSTILGLVLMGGAAYLWTNKGTIPGLSDSLVIVAIGLGASVFLVSFLGIYGAMRRQKVALVVYGIVVFLLIVGEIVGVVLLAQYVGVLDAATVNSDVATVTRQAANAVNDVLFSAYTVCCVQNAAFCSTDVLPGNSGYCAPVQGNCTSAVEDQEVACFSNPNGAQVGQEFCIALQSTELIGVAVTGGTKCGGGDPLKFRNDFIEWVQANITLVFYAAGFAGAIELMSLVFAGILFFHSSAAVISQIKHEHDDEIVAYEMNHPVQSPSFSFDDQRLRSGSSASVARPISFAPGARPMSVSNARPISIARPESASTIDHETGLAIARPVDDE